MWPVVRSTFMLIVQLCSNSICCVRSAVLQSSLQCQDEILYQFPNIVKMALVSDASCRGKQGPKLNCWRATLHSPTQEELTDLWKFNNADGGPVPDKFELGYLIIASDFSGIYNARKRRRVPCARMYFEILRGNQVRLTSLMRWFPRTEFQSRDGITPEEARDHCKMAGKWIERGLISTVRQAMNSQEAFDKYWSGLIAKIQSFGQWEDLLIDYELAPILAQRLLWCKAIWDTRPTVIPALNMKSIGFHWQCRFHLFLRNVEPDDRYITYVVNQVGGTGKTRFTKHMFAHHKVMLAACAPPEGHEDAAKANYYMFHGQSIIIFDVSRQSGEPDYNCVEILKNGCVISTKFIPKVKVHNSPHIVIFCNLPPSHEGLSADRWNVIYKLSDDMSIFDFFPPDKFPGVLNLDDPFGVPRPSWTNELLHPSHARAPITPVGDGDSRTDLAHQAPCDDFCDNDNFQPELLLELGKLWEPN